MGSIRVGTNTLDAYPYFADVDRIDAPFLTSCTACCSFAGSQSGILAILEWIGNGERGREGESGREGKDRIKHFPKK